MLTLWAYVRYAERPASLGRYLTRRCCALRPGADGQADAGDAAVGAAVAGLLAAGAAGAFGTGENGKKRRRRCGVWVAGAEKVPLLVLAAGSCAITFLVQVEVSGFQCPTSCPGPIGSPTRLVSYVAYLGKLFCPVGLAAFYPHPADRLPTWQAVAALLVLLGHKPRRPLPGAAKASYLIVGWLWYLGMLVPVIGLVQVGSQAMADRYTYLTQIGLYIAAKNRRKKPRIGRPAAAARVPRLFQPCQRKHKVMSSHRLNPSTETAAPARPTARAGCRAAIRRGAIPAAGAAAC